MTEKSNSTKIVVISVVAVIVCLILLINRYVGFLYPYIPFYNYYGVIPSNDSWKTCQGTVTYMNGTQAVTDNEKLFEYWTVMAIKSKNPDLCKNVGITEGSDVIYPDEHGKAVEECNRIYLNYPKYEKYCDSAY